ncbi:hypothetical protein DRQ53_03210 [bacterium]|nr:MAG: hypothetical protein DRQ32_05960 [bacterium]RKZ17543.1 MAG: hypothetical protein DRQ53_03210 [bacterium]
MRMLMNRYLDGELSEDEATAFIEALENDPSLGSELHAHESIHAAGRSLGAESAPAGFADRLMQRLADESGSHASHRSFRANWWPALAAAAMIVFAFGLGRVTNWGPGSLASGSQPAPLSISAEPIAFASSPGSVQGLRVVHVTYTPGDTSLQSVFVAGSFNAWNATEVPMHLDGAVWTAVLVLPPGSYEYMFVEDGERWVTDPLAVRSRDDGFGSRNAVLDLEA